MKVYIYQEEWIVPMDYAAEKASIINTHVYGSFEAAESEWAWISNCRHEREGHWVEPAEKEDINSEGESIRYYKMHYGNDEVMIKTIISERTVL